MSNMEKNTLNRRINSKLSRKSKSPEEKRNYRRPLPKPNETEEEAVIRRFHDAQRMARFRARRKKALEESKALQADKLTRLALIAELKRRNILFQISNSVNTPSIAENLLTEDDSDIVTIVPITGDSKYSQLLAIIQEIGKNVKLTYAGSRSSIEKLKTGIGQAKLLIKDCLMETELQSRRSNY